MRSRRPICHPPATKWSKLIKGEFRVLALPGKRDGTRSTTRAAEPEPDDDEICEPSEDVDYMLMHQEFEALEHKGFDVIYYVRKRMDDDCARSPRVTASPYDPPPTPGKSCFTTGLLTSGDERALRRWSSLVVGKPPAACCAACPPFFKQYPQRPSNPRPDCLFPCSRLLTYRCFERRCGRQHRAHVWQGDRIFADANG